MQIQKDEIRKRILQAAEIEFLNAGFRRSSMRRIAQQAGITAGNIYAYFPGKEALFEQVVSPALESVERLMTLHNDSRTPLTALADQIAGVFLTHQRPFRILMESAEGTRYEDTRENLTQAAAGKIQREHLGALSPALQTRYFADVLANAMIAGIFQLLRQYDGDQEQFKSALKGLVYLLFHTPQTPDRENGMEELL